MSVVQYDDDSFSSKAKVLDNNLIDRDWAMTKFVASVRGLAQVVDYESNMLESSGIPDYKEINLCKIRGLRDLNKSISDVKRYMNADIENEVESLLSDLQEKLHRNSELLKTHLDAINDFSQAMQMTTRIKETDEIDVSIERSK
ncbi:aryl carrier-like protein [Bartonella callosciuri]|uniref:Aryl carrier-like protein n=1 Tax=Bartonella callosciuri TaxID=686223 RepID=A0A840NMN2_9HYPH|nr:flagellar protein FlgN [Bartonella callosciuri]MBB5073956.1 aryl carrier-like protein [Bartonella callosciuri]